MYCKNCGTGIQEEQKVCSNCGSKNPDLKKKSKSKKKLIIISVIVIIIALCIGLFITNKINVEKHSVLVQNVANDQMTLYTNKLIPALMGDIKEYNIENLNYTEINSEGQAQYAIQIDCNIIIGDKKFNYPIKVLFNDNYIDKPQNYIYNDDISKNIIAYEKEYKTEQEKKDRLNQTVKMTAKDLYNAYDKNEVDANDKYTGKTGIITGIIESIDVSGGNPCIRLYDGKKYSSVEVSCFFNGGSQAIATLKKGKTITIKGGITGKNIIDVRVENCELD